MTQEIKTIKEEEEGRKERLEEDNICDWFNVSEVKGNKKVTFIQKKLVERYKKLGFFRYYTNEVFHWIRVTEKVVNRVDLEEIKDDFEDFIESIDNETLADKGVYKDMLINKMYGGINTFFSDSLLKRMRSKEEIVFQEHTKYEAFFYYQNGYVEVKKDSIKLRPYSELEKFIWRDRILSRDFKQVDYKDSNYYKFLQNISGWRKPPGEYENGRLDASMKSRFDALKSIIGYCLHGYKESKRKGLLLTDSRISDYDEANGRSGKTLFVRCIGKVLDNKGGKKGLQKNKTAVFVEINGKDYDPRNKFKYQACKPETALICVNDLPRNYEIENNFNDISDGVQVEAKNMPIYTIYPTIIFTSNMTVRLDGGSARDRIIEYELADYYDENLSPSDEFGEWFFTDWNSMDWHKYDSLKMECIKYYLENGLQKVKSINLEERKFNDETSPEFVEFIQEEFKHDLYKEVDRKFIYQKFINKYDFVQDGFDQQGLRKAKKWFTVNKFTKWNKAFARYNKDIKELSVRSSGSTYFFKFKPVKEDLPFD